MNSGIILDIHSTWATYPWLPDCCPFKTWFPLYSSQPPCFEGVPHSAQLAFRLRVHLELKFLTEPHEYDFLSTPFKVPYLWLW